MSGVAAPLLYMTTVGADLIQGERVKLIRIR